MRTNQNVLLAQDVYTRGLALQQGIATAAIMGYAYVPGAVSRQACEAMESEVAGLELEEGDHVTHPINQGTSREVHQLHERAYLPIGDIRVPIATLVTRALSTEVKALRRQYPNLSTWLATEAGYQRYRDSDDHISPHRDRRNDQLLAATITINGSAMVLIHETLGDLDDYTPANLRQTDEFRTSPGGVMLLRASGLGNGVQTIHEVMPPEKGSRLILNLRMRPDILKSPRETAVK